MTHSVQELREALDAEARTVRLRVSYDAIRAGARRLRRKRLGIGATAVALALAAAAAPVALTDESEPTGIGDSSAPAAVAPILMDNPTKDDPIATGIRLDDGRELVLYYDLGLELGGRDAFGVIGPLPFKVATTVIWPRPTIFDSLFYDAQTINGSNVIVGGVRGGPDRITAVIDGREVDAGYVRIGGAGGLYWVQGMGKVGPTTTPRLRAYDRNGVLLDSVG